MWMTTMALTLLGATAGQEPTQASGAKPADDVHDAFVELEDEYQEAQQDFYAEAQAAYEAFEDLDDQSGGFQMPDAIEPDWYPKFADLAVAGSLEANVWCIQNHGASMLDGAAAREDKTERYVEVLSEKRSDELLTQLMRPLTQDARANPEGQPARMSEGGPVPIGREAAFRFLDAIFEVAEGDELRAHTLYARGQAIIPYSRATEEQTKAGMVYYRRAAAEFPKTEIGQRCGGMIFEAENLQIGQTAPDIVGKDHDGNDIKLSDFKDKVTVIDFWGFW